MDIRQELARSQELEAERVRFLERTRSPGEAQAFARRTRGIYRRAVLNRSAPAAEPVYRLRLIGSYCYLRHYLNPGPENGSGSPPPARRGGHD
ncbi:hypothetical protein LMH63_08720 [Spiribacter halobius]|nr:hypothetical protein [Spiribacter halobius]UEX79711.1 hypothetical protein LMH63_08720 [Spiribacter halobius]